MFGWWRRRRRERLAARRTADELRVVRALAALRPPLATAPRVRRLAGLSLERTLGALYRLEEAGRVVRRARMDEGPGASYHLVGRL